MGCLELQRELNLQQAYEPLGAWIQWEREIPKRAGEPIDAWEPIGTWESIGAWEPIGACEPMGAYEPMGARCPKGALCCPNSCKRALDPYGACEVPLDTRPQHASSKA